MDCRGYIIVRGEGVNADYWYIHLLPDVNNTHAFIALSAIYTDPGDAEVDADRIMAFVYGEEIDEGTG